MLIEAAVGNQDGDTDFHMSERPGKEWSYSSSIRLPKWHLIEYPDITFDKTIKVKILKLDTWHTPGCKIDYIWADVQGAEEDLILGGLRTLSETHYFYTEFSDKEMYEGQITLAGIKKLLPNFTVEKIIKDNVLLRNTTWK
jgi:FkbM family methyltransferase